MRCARASTCALTHHCHYLGARPNDLLCSNRCGTLLTGKPNLKSYGRALIRGGGNESHSTASRSGESPAHACWQLRHTEHPRPATEPCEAVRGSSGEHGGGAPGRATEPDIWSL